MKKRVLFTALALCMGWYVGSLTAEQTEHHETSAATHHEEASEHGGASGGISGGGGEHAGGGALAAKAITHGAVAGAPWLCCVLLGSAGLFAGAVVIGIPTLKLKGDESADDDSHDDHH